MRYGSNEVNVSAALLQVAFCLLYFPEIVREGNLILKDSKLVVVAYVLLAFTLVGWMYLYIPVQGLYRSWFYAVQPFFFLASVAWFREVRISGFRFLYLVKLSSVFIALILIFQYMLTLDPAVSPNSVKGHPPIYRHLRHLNYDLGFLVMLGIAFFVSIKPARERCKLFFVSVIYGILGFASIWSGGRGEILALVVFLSILAGSNFRLVMSRDVVFPILVFTIGGGIVFLVGSTYLIDGPLHKTMEMDSVNAVSSGRISIWAKSLNYFKDSWLFGYGPDAFLRHPIFRTGPVQPHNFIVQWLLEFGVIGFLGMSLISAWAIRLCIRFLRSNAVSATCWVVASAVLSNFIYALVDGIFYHGLPFIMMSLMVAYLWVESDVFSEPRTLAQ